jgi:hypothetical protein
MARKFVGIRANFYSNQMKSFMKYKVDTKELYTDKGEFVKKLECEKKADWENMMPGKNDLERICTHCNKSVMDVEFLSDDEILFFVKKRPETCIKVRAQII